MVNKNLVILHGWQSSIQRWECVQKRLAQNFTVYCPSLPGFGDNKIFQGWKLTDYADWLREYLKKNKIKNPVLLSHSFGGRVAVKYLAAGGQASKLVLIASSGLKNKKTLKLSFFRFLAKVGKTIFSLPVFFLLKGPARWLLYQMARENDYYKADKWQKLTMQKILQEDISPLLVKIKIPTLILWGKKDKLTPLSGAYIFQKNIAGSTLKTYEMAGHDLPFKYSRLISEQVINFCQQ